MLKQLKIRRYKLRDNKIVWELHRLGSAEVGIKVQRNNPLDSDLNNIERVYFPDGDFIVGEYKGQVVAMGAFKKISDETAEVKRMRVHPDFQRRGFGTIILSELEKRAKKMGYRKVVLDTSQKNVKSNSFYPKLGYKEVGRQELRSGYHAVLYEKVL